MKSIWFIILWIILGGCFTTGVSMNKAIVPKVEKIVLSGKIDMKTGDVKLEGSAKLVGETLTAPIQKPNYRRHDGIAVVFNELWNLLKCWFWDLIIVTLLITLFTELLGNSYLKMIPKMIVSILVGILISFVYIVVLRADWGYAFTLNGMCILSSNVGWEIGRAHV